MDTGLLWAIFLGRGQRPCLAVILSQVGTKYWLSAGFACASVTVYLGVVPLCGGLELLVVNHPGESLFSVRSLE